MESELINRGGNLIGTSIIFVSPTEQVLLALRDNIANIPYPNCWDIPGGRMEPDETPEQCIQREMMEEIGYPLLNPQVFNVYQMPDRTEYTFWERAQCDLVARPLTEGQRLQWFDESEIQSMPDALIAFGFKGILLDFFRERPFSDQRTSW